MQSSHFHHAPENWVTGLSVNTQNKLSITFPADGVLVTLNILVEGELGRFHCTEARFNSSWQ
jgi:hypothetical protein